MWSLFKHSHSKGWSLNHSCCWPLGILEISQGSSATTMSTTGWESQQIDAGATDHHDLWIPRAWDDHKAYVPM